MSGHDAMPPGLGGDDALNADLMESLRDTVRDRGKNTTHGRVESERIARVAIARSLPANERPGPRERPQRSTSRDLTHPALISQGMYNFASEFDIIQEHTGMPEHHDGTSPPAQQRRPLRPFFVIAPRPR
jgi:hypothetical protein